jgi:iron complex transport system substrate-binding protein
MRIVSLLPSATEIVCDLGLGDLLVGRSAECDWPPSISALPVVTAARVDTQQLDSAGIDEAVRAALLEGLSLYAVDEELLEELRPDLIITQDLCRVCAVSSVEVGALRAVDAEVVSLDPRTIGEVEASVRQLADRLDACRRGTCEAGADVVARMRRTIVAAMESVRGLPLRRVFVAEWLDPPFAAGHWVPEMVDLAGGVDVLGRAGQPSYPTTWERVAAEQPELIVVAPCGFDAVRAEQEASRFSLPAPHVSVDANAYFSRPAPRIADGVAQLASIIHPNHV